MDLNATQLSALSRLFSPSVFREMAGQGRSPLFARLLVQTQLFPTKSLDAETVSSAFDAAFAVLRKSGKRDEYVYRAALTHRILLGKHSLNTASMLTEFRVGSCKADLVILNGTSTVYEIKSDRDSLSRLSNQVAHYRKAFAQIYVIAGEAHIQNVLECVSEDVGVMSLVRWNRIRTVREAEERPDLICPVTVFDSLRIAEAKEVLQNLGVTVPDAPNTMQRSIMGKYFARLDPVQIHDEMVKTLKKTRNLATLRDLIDQLPDSLQPAALAIQVRQADHDRLVKAVQTPLSDAMTWT